MEYAIIFLPLIGSFVSGFFGKHIGEKLKEKKITDIIFDRNGYNYHGRVKAFVDAVRDSGLSI